MLDSEKNSIVKEISIFIFCVKFACYCGMAELMPLSLFLAPGNPDWFWFYLSGTVSLGQFWTKSMEL